MKAFVGAIVERLRPICRLVRCIPVAIDRHEIPGVQAEGIAVRAGKAGRFGIDRGMHVHGTLQYFNEIPRSRYRKKSRRSPPVNKLPSGLTRESSLTTACGFTNARPIIWQGWMALLSSTCAMRKSRQPRCTAANFVAGCREVAEAAGTNSEFALSDRRCGIRGDPVPGQNHPAWQHVVQIVPDTCARQTGNGVSALPNIRPRVPRCRRARPWRPRAIPASPVSP